MTPEALATFHASAMPLGRAWSAGDFSVILDTPGTILTLIPSSLQKYAGGSAQSARGAEPPPPATARQAQHLLAFALGRVTLDEAELLTIAVNPDQQRQGLGIQCLTKFETEASEIGAKTAYLEVAVSNRPARRLYTSNGWTEHGRRPNYYTTPTGREDAILMRKALDPA